MRPGFDALKVVNGRGCWKTWKILNETNAPNCYIPEDLGEVRDIPVSENAKFDSLFDAHYSCFDRGKHGS